MATPSTSPTLIRVGVNFPTTQQANWIRHYFTVEPNDLIVAKWSSVQPEVIKLIKSLPWAVLSVVRGSYMPPHQRHPETDALILDHFFFPEPEPDSNPIVLVSAPVESQACWQTMADRVYSICTNSGLGHCRVMFESARYPLLAAIPHETLPDEPLHGPYLDEEELAEDVPLGSSFGPVAEGMRTSASIGGTIKLQMGSEEPKELLLSAFHPFARLVQKEELLHGWRHNPCAPIELRMPSVQDTILAKPRSLQEIHNAQEDLRFNNVREDITPERRLQNAARLKESITRSQTSLHKLEDHTTGNHGQGFLQQGSGLNGGLDWSLSSFNDRNVNTLPAKRDVSIAMARAGFTIHESALPNYGRNEITIAEAKADRLVIKRGRTTGVTVGRVNALPSDILVSELLDMKTEIAMQVYAILEKKEGFVDYGDSGAWVLTTDGDWVGSIVGHQTATVTSAGASIALGTKAEKIIEDIEDFTGGKVVFPRRFYG